MYRNDLLGKWRAYLATKIGQANKRKPKHKRKHTLLNRAIRLISIIVIELSSLQAILIRKAGK